MVVKAQAKIRYTYRNMISRCCKPEYRDYYRYSGRGITVCDRWQSNLQDFIDDMYPSMCEHIAKYGLSNTTLDRIDTTKGYLPNNCRWATRKVQAKNKKPAQIDSKVILLYDHKDKKAWRFSKIADAAKFLLGDYDSNRRAIHESLIGNRSQVKGYEVFVKTINKS